jgi:hypothetical protein
MIIPMKTILTALVLLLLAGPGIHAQSASESKSIASVTSGLKRIDGYIPLFWDQKSGRMWMEIARFDEEFLYQVSLPAGVGSNPIGLDRGQLGPSAVVRFERVGPRVLLIQSNYRYRALSNDAAERRAVADSFARSVLWGFKVEATQGERVLVDATAFFLRDAHGVAEKLRLTRQGSFRFDESRSAFHLPRTKGFPANTEIETLISLTGDDAGPLLRSVAPTAQVVTVRQHHSLVELPDLEANGYQPRDYDPRVSAMPHTFYDYASPFTAPIEKRWIRRHRLQKKDPRAAVSEAVRPIIYYVDNGVPEPIRSALLEGASWWAQAFEAAGFRNGFQVRILPDDADPMDIRYNMINWVHRSTRGWSYGASVVDPRTGEIIKGNVSLGSLRIRQDMLLGTGMIAPGLGMGAMGATGDQRAMPEWQCLAAESPEVDYLAVASLGDAATDSAAMSLARIRQLSAHEVGHTLGFSHNFAASSYGRASVMDYPAPLVGIRDGRLDLADAYAVGMGVYDIFSVRFAYTQYESVAEERAGLKKLVEDGVAAGMLFIDDGDGRDVATAHPQASVWDNGTDAVATLRHELEVRRIGIQNYGLGNIAVGQPLSDLEAKLLPLYLHHRYQLMAAAKSIGGLRFSYAVRTAAGPSPAPARQIVPAAQQREALKVILGTLSPKELALPGAIIALIPPVATGFDGGTAEYFGRRTDPAFDPLGIASVAANLTFDALLAPARLERLVVFNAEDPSNPSLREVLAALIGATWKAPAPTDGYHRAILQTTRSLLVDRLIETASLESLSSLARAEVRAALRDILALARKPSPAAARSGVDPDPTRDLSREEIERFFNRTGADRLPARRLPTPAGDPIGGR